MTNRRLSRNAQKSFCNHLTEEAGAELVDVIHELLRRVELLENNKVDVTRLVPEPDTDHGPRYPAASLPTQSRTKPR